MPVSASRKEDKEDTVACVVEHYPSAQGEALTAQLAQRGVILVSSPVGPLVYTFPGDNLLALLGIMRQMLSAEYQLGLDTYSFAVHRAQQACLVDVAIVDLQGGEITVSNGRPVDPQAETDYCNHLIDELRCQQVTVERSTEVVVTFRITLAAVPSDENEFFALLTRIVEWFPM